MASSSWTYDVFLSFRGEDTRSGFTTRLYRALKKLGIHAFIDDAVLERGAEISASLFEAIERSQIALVIFSPDYASSRWCLDELVKIMECKSTQALVVLPIFCHGVDPADVRHQRGTYGEAMERHQQRFGRENDRKLRLWMQALTDAANISGFPFSAYGGENELLDSIVEDVSKKVVVGKLFVAKHPVGIEKRVDELTIEWSETTASQKALIIGIWGMGGLGKTTLAKAIYNKIGCHQFRARSFLENIRDNDLVKLQNQLIVDITKTEVFKIHDIGRGKSVIQARFPRIKAFVVLDDVDSVNQLDALCGGTHEWFHPGSVIIITTRDEHLLNLLNADYKYTVSEMNDIESFELFNWHAFKQTTPLQEFSELAKGVVKYCNRLPLALEILGSFLRKRTVQQWEAALSKLERIPNKDIHAKLRISYDGLDDYMQKDIFLDICCFFIDEDINYVAQILDSCGLHPKDGLPILIERSLIKVGRNDELQVHDLLQEMGKEIIRENSPKNPEDWSRLWSHEDVLDVLIEHTGTKAIEGISLKLPETHGEHVIDSEAFKEMKKLRLLQLDHVNVEGDYKHLSKKLRWLCWHGFPSKYIPNNLYQKNLVALDFKYSKLKVVWKEPQLLQMLKTLNLSHSSYLKQTPNFTKLPNLEMLLLEDCPSLMLVHQSIGDLKKILHVNVKDCKCLRALPRSIYKLKSLKTLILSGCTLIDRLEEDFEQMESLTMLKADNTAITTVPKSLARLKELIHGYVSLCGHEGRAQDIFPSLIWSWMSPTKSPQSCSEAFVLSISSLVSSALQYGSFHGLSPFLGDLANLRGMWEECRPQFRYNGKMETLLDALYETNFMGLELTQDTPRISCMEASASSEGHGQVHNARPAEFFDSLMLQMGVCDKADLLKDRILQGWNYGGWDDSNLPGDQYPDWFLYKGEGNSVILKVTQVIGCDLKAMLLNVVYSSSLHNNTPQFLINVFIINYTKNTVKQHKGDSLTFHEDAEWHSTISSVEPGDYVELVFRTGPQFPVNKIAAYLIFDGSKRHSLRDLPKSMYKLKSLKTLILSGCSLIAHLEEEIEQMESLTTLMADNTAITKVPFSLARLGGLVHGYVPLCGHEGRAQDIFPSLIRSWMSRNNVPQSSIEEFAQILSSIGISVGGNSGFMELESTRNAPQISSMEPSGSSECHDPLHFDARPPDSIDTLLLQLGVFGNADVLKEQFSQGWDDSQLPDDWFIYKGEGHSVVFKVPQVKGCDLKAMLLNVVFSYMDYTTPQFLINVRIINHKKAIVKHLQGDSATFHEDAERQSIISIVEPGDLVELLVLSIGPQFLVKKAAAYLNFTKTDDFGL